MKQAVFSDEKTACFIFKIPCRHYFQSSKISRVFMVFAFCPAFAEHLFPKPYKTFLKH